MPFWNDFCKKREKDPKTNQIETTSKSSLLDGLNPFQAEAVTTTDGYIRVIAGAGSGKTKALTHRYAYLVQEAGISTASILCVTFTNKAAGVMKRRIHELIGEEGTGMVCTFHGFCVKLLKEDIHAVNYPTSFMILDKEDTNEVLQVCYEDLGLTMRDMTFKKAREYIGRQKREMTSQYLELMTAADSAPLQAQLAEAKTVESRIFYRFLWEQRKAYALDFQDLIYLALYILEENETILTKWQHRLEYIMVDEFQDVNDAQYRLAAILSGYHKNLFVVGDPDQTIYSFRGAQVNYILDFDKAFPAVKTILMEENYRSTQSILTASNALIQKNMSRMDKHMRPMRELAGRAVYFHAKNEREEAEWIATQIKSLLEQGVNFCDIGILYRMHALSRSLEEAFIREKIPYTIYNGVAFYGRKEVKDALCYLRLVLNKDNLSFRRVVNEPKRQIGKKKMATIEAYAEEHSCSLYEALEQLAGGLFRGNAGIGAMRFLAMVEKYHDICGTMPIFELTQQILQDSGYEEMLQTEGDQDRLDNLATFKQSIKEFESSAGESVFLRDYLEQISLFTDADTADKDSVKIMTVHSAKGMEFPYVFVYELSEGIFPSRYANTRDKMEEERRLAYVAYTRAKEFLFLTNADGFSEFGGFRYPSRFIFNAEKANLDYVVELPDELIESAQNMIRFDEENIDRFQREMLPPGTRIFHPTFEAGTILSVNEDASTYSIQFDDMETPREITMRVRLKMI